MLIKLDCGQLNSISCVCGVRMAGCLPLFLELLVVVILTTAVANEETDFKPVSLDVTFKKDNTIASKSYLSNILVKIEQATFI